MNNIYKGVVMNKKEKNKLISLNIPESLHKRMKTKKNINWSEKVRSFLESELKDQDDKAMIKKSFLEAFKNTYEVNHKVSKNGEDWGQLSFDLNCLKFITDYDCNQLISFDGLLSAIKSVRDTGNENQNASFFYQYFISKLAIQSICLTAKDGIDYKKAEWFSMLFASVLQHGAEGFEEEAYENFEDEDLEEE